MCGILAFVANKEPLPKELELKVKLLFITLLILKTCTSICTSTHQLGQKKNPNLLFYKELGFLLGGPTWARTRDQLIMSQLL